MISWMNNKIAESKRILRDVKWTLVLTRQKSSLEHLMRFLEGFLELAIQLMSQT